MKFGDQILDRIWCIFRVENGIELFAADRQGNL